MTEPMPALSIVAMPGRRRRTIELCQEAERRGFTGIYVAEPDGQHVDVRGAGVADREDPLRHLDRADLPAHHGRLLPERGDDARGLGRAASAWASASPTGRPTCAWA
jgi:hypothetical protein